MMDMKPHPRQLDVELNTIILAANHSGRPQLVEKLKGLRKAVLGYARYEEERGAKETALLKEVERVDRAAAKIAMETERLKRLRDEAMMIVRRVEPGVLEDERSVTQDDMLYINKDLKYSRDIILNDNSREDDSEPKLTKMFGKSSQLRRHGSYGSLVQHSPASKVFMPPPMPLIQNWGDPAYPPYPYPYPMYGGMPPPHMAPPVYYGQEDYNSQARKGYQSRPREAGQEAEMSTDEGENTSNDAGDISSSEASGGGRRRKVKSRSPKPKLIPSHVQSSDRVVHQPSKSDKEKPLNMTSIPDTNEEKKPKDLPEKVDPEPELLVNQVSEAAKDKPDNFEDNLMMDSDNVDDERKLYSPESELISKEEEEEEEEEKEVIVEKNASVERERKVGVKRVEESDAYQQMLHGGAKKTIAAPVLIEDESTSDDIEAQVAVMTKPRSTFKAVSNSLHNPEDESLSEPAPAPVGLRGQAGHQVGHPLPLLVGGRLGHPAAQRVGVMALGSNTGADLSGPENDEDDDDFWS